MEKEAEAGKAYPRWGMVIDLDRCVGCQTCTAACRAENNVPVAGPDQAAMGRSIFWNEVIYSVEGEYPYLQAAWYPRPCMHCDNAPCQKVCPVGATYTNEMGAVLVDWDRCIGCRYCTTACPYNARYFNWFAPRFDKAHRRILNPDVPIRPRGVVEKCTFCSHRIEKASRRIKEKEQGSLRLFMTEARRGLSCSAACHEHPVLLRQRNATHTYIPVPACVQACPAGARFFGDLDDPDSVVAQLARSRRAMRLLDHLGTEPKVYYLRKQRI